MEISKEKQIEEMAECCPYFWNGACTVDAANPTDCDLMCEMFGFMSSLVKAGYRKQSEGEWGYHECVSSYDGAISGYSCSCCCAFIHEEVYEDTSFPNNFCPNCGAKMKGE